ncbi:hypothetical protein FRC11_006988 [Ceratobasidium sp. 423]|nr:hypothetical protein FRC11_006988 [Ceratobasidium sp. 423]
MSLHMHPPRVHHAPPPLSNPHPSLTHVPSEDDEEEDDQVATGDQPQQRTVRKRSSKACDNCRKAKCKCEKSPDNPACRNCVLLGQECTFLGPSRKRGPPKGYIDAIEARLHQLEALLGTLIASPDPRAQSLIADMITDPLARHIIARVDESPFGSRGKDSNDARDPKARTHINIARTAILNGQVGFDVPPRDWQDELGARIIGSSHTQPSRHAPTPPARSPPDAQRRRLSSSGSVSPAQPRHTHLPPDESDGEPDPLTDALGQLSLNEHHQLRYHGKASGLHILAQAPAYRRDRAQDLGLHRSIDKWQAAGAKTFSAAEKQTRRCIWFGCVVMDKYVSTYIGRPLAVFERDYDTRWPDQDAEEEDQDWVDIAKEDNKGSYAPVPGRVLECFAAGSRLSAVLSRIVEALYSIRPAPGGSKSAERIQLEEELEKWLLNLPAYLRYDITRGVLEGSGKVPPPHVLTLHMMYWCSVLLLHRPS